MIYLTAEQANTPIADLEEYGLEEKVIMILEGNYGLYIKDLVSVTEEQLLATVQIGPTKIKEIQESLFRFFNVILPCNTVRRNLMAEEEQDEIAQALDRHARAQHAMQTGVLADLNSDPRSGEPKHLRVGINTALCDMAGLVRLLISKGVITEEEYTKAIADEMEREVDRYEEQLFKQYGTKVKLH